MKLIGLLGQKRSGKDTVYEILADLHPNIIRVAFADALKEEVAAAIGQSVEFVEQNKTQLRLLLQAWGADYRREMCDSNYWIDQARAKIVAAGPDALVVVTDVRYPNEVYLVEELGGMTVGIERGIESDDTHSSENALTDFRPDATLLNHGTLEELRHATQELFLNQYDIFQPDRIEPGVVAPPNQTVSTGGTLQTRLAEIWPGATETRSEETLPRLCPV